MDRFDVYYDSSYREIDGDLRKVAEDINLTKIPETVLADAFARKIKGDITDIHYLYKLFRYTGEIDELGLPETEVVEWEEIADYCRECNFLFLDHYLYNGYCDACQD